MAVFVLYTAASAQVKYKGFIESGASAIVCKTPGQSYQFSTSQGIKLGQSFIGLGIGYDIYSILNPHYKKGSQYEKLDNEFLEDVYGYPWIKMFNYKTIPVFVDFKYCNEGKRYAPVIDVKGGLSIGTMFTGPFLEGGIGERVEITDSLALSASLFCRFFYIGIIEDSIARGEWLNNVGVKLAIDFGQ